MLTGTPIITTTTTQSLTPTPSPKNITLASGRFLSLRTFQLVYICPKVFAS